MKTLINFGKDQQPGTSIKSTVISDGVYYQEIVPIGRIDNIHVSMVIDMGKIGPTPVSANEIFENSIDFIKSNLSLDYENLLLNLSQKIDRFCAAYAPGVPVSYSVAVIDGVTLYAWSSGKGTEVYIVQDDKTEKLPSNSFSPGSFSSSHLVSGDKVILCTDGLFTMVQSMDELAVIDRYDNPTFAAKHLTSLSMGRNVEDLVSVGVINYGHRKNKKLPFYILGGLFAAALITTLLIVLLQKPKIAAPLPEDFGVAILVSGQLQAINPVDGSSSKIESFSVINPGTHLINRELEPVNLRLKTRVFGSNATENIPGVEIHLAASSEIILTSLEYADLSETGPAPADLLDQSTIEMLAGSIAITNQGSRTYNILLNRAEGEEPVMFSLMPGSESTGVIGVTRDRDRVTVYCLAGSCSLISADISIGVPELNKVEFSLEEKFHELIPNPISSGEKDLWMGITGY
jgi:hypothetical protein